MDCLCINKVYGKRQKLDKIYIKWYNGGMEGFYTLAFVSFCKRNVLINMETEPSKYY